MKILAAKPKMAKMVPKPPLSLWSSQQEKVLSKKQAKKATRMDKKAMSKAARKSC